MRTWQSFVRSIPGSYGYYYCFNVFIVQISPGLFGINPKFKLVFEKITYENRVFSHRLWIIWLKCALWGPGKASYAVFQAPTVIFSALMHSSYEYLQASLELIGNSNWFLRKRLLKIELMFLPPGSLGLGLRLDFFFFQVDLDLVSDLIFFCLQADLDLVSD